MDPAKHAEQGGLVGERPDQGRFTARLIADRQSFEPIGPAIREMPFDSDLVNVWLVHKGLLQ